MNDGRMFHGSFRRGSFRRRSLRSGTVASCAVIGCAVIACAMAVIGAGCEERSAREGGESARGARATPVHESGVAEAPAPAAAPAADAGGDAGVVKATDVRDGREFRPSVHGFGFVNSFTGSAAPPAIRDAEGGLLGAIRGVTEGSVGSNFGLCGGMSAAAADYFYAGMTPPRRSDVPTEGEVLRGYIYGRQVDSLGALGLMAAKFIERMALPDVSELQDGVWSDSAAARTTGELVPILERLDRGELVPLGLVHVRAGKGSAAWENHQVLAYAFVREEGMVTIRVYDPNAPLDDGAVVRLRREGVADAPEQWRGELEYVRGDGRMARRPVRTLFAMPYERRTPPVE